MKIARFCLVTLCLTALSTLMAAGQETRGTIRGTVTDPNKQAVPNATVIVTDLSRNSNVTLTTNNDGLYLANYLFPSTYQVVVEAPGFKKTVRSNVLLQIAQNVSVNVELEVGGATETVTVTADVPQLNGEDASLGEVVDGQRITELPLVHGDPYTLIGLANGTAATGNARLDRPFEPTHIVGYAVNGVRGNRMDLTIDGVASTATANANEVIASYVPPPDIVQEFKVQTATFDAQFGNTEGSVTSISIKSGTNQFHGSAYLFLQPGSLAANDAFGKARGQERPDTKSDRFGGYLSGPVRIPWVYNGKDKTFFLFGFEGINDSRPRFDASNVWVPTAALANGDFSAYQCPAGVTTGCTNIYDPLTRDNGGSGTTYTAQQFPGNVIPSNRINPVARVVLGYMGGPKNPGLVGNILDSTLREETKPYTNYTFRVDQNISQKNHLFMRGSWYDRSSLYNRYTDSPYAGVNFVFASRQAVIDNVHTFNSTTFLNVKYGFNRFIRASGAQDDAVGFDLSELWPGSNINNLVGEGIRRFPRFNFPSPGTLGNGLTNENRPVSSHNLAGILNKSIGTHSIKWGAEMRIYREDDNFASNDQSGQFTFNNTYTRRSTTTSGANAGPQEFNGLQAFAAFLLGYPSTANITRRADYSEFSKVYGFFMHDDWKITRRLTLNLGLRYEIETPLVERQNKSVSGFDFGYTQPDQAAARNRLTTNPVVGYVPGTNINPATFNVNGGLMFAGVDTGSGLYNVPKDTILPRLGFAYRLGDKTVIRGGMGLFAGFLGQRRGDVIQPGFTQTTTVPTTNLPNGAQIPYSISEFPNVINIIEPVGNARGRQTSLGGAVSFFNQDPEVSRQLRFQIGFQHQLPYGFLFEAAYVGNRGYNIEIVKDLNALPVQYLNGDALVNGALSPDAVTNNTILGQNVANPFAGLASFAGSSIGNGSNIARHRLLRPYPHFTTVLTTNNDGESWYNSGQFGLRRRFAGGHTLNASYTWSKWLQATEYLNAGDATPTKMISDQDTPHKFAVSGILQLPFGRGKRWAANNGVVDRIIGGWQVQGSYTFQVGFPVAFGSYSLTGGTTSGDIIYVGGDIALPSGQRSTAKWFNTAAFSQVSPGIGHLRTIPFRFTDVRRDNVNNVDFSMLKNTEINERMKFQFRVELINAFNSVYLPAPSTALGSSFGTIALATANQSNYARRVQIGFKFLF